MQHLSIEGVPELSVLNRLYIVCLMALTIAGCKYGAQTGRQPGSVAEVRADVPTGHWRRASTKPPEKRFGQGLPPRDVIDVNSNWEFNYFPSAELDRSLAATNFDSSSWPVVSIPHTWSTYETTGELHPFIAAPSERDDPYWWNGWGVYRKTITIAKDVSDKVIRIEFDGVQKYAQLWVNGQYVGDHKGGYTSFYFDLTPHLKYGEANSIVLFVQNKRNDAHRIAPMSAGNWNVYGGIYRDVRLVISSKVHIPYQGSHEHDGGISIVTPMVTHEEASVRVETHLANADEISQTALVEVSVYDPDGKLVAASSKSVTVAPGAQARTQSDLLSIDSPSLWSPETPALYTADVSASLHGEIVDRYQSRFGLRWFEWDRDRRGLYLNGKRIDINGTNRHQEYPWLGDAIPHWITYFDLYDIRRSLGHNFIRAAHYPNDPYVYELTDLLGLITVQEVPNIKNQDFDEDVQRQNVIEMIRRDRNHPSILFWSMGNETSDPADPAWARAEDPSRIVHLRKGALGDADSLPDHTHEDIDLENLLRVTPGGLFDFGRTDLREKYNPEHGQHAGSEEWQHAMALQPNGSIRGSMNEDVVVWLYNDHGADREYLNSTLKHVNPKGWVDPYRRPKYIYHLWRANFSDQPSVFVQSHFWRREFLGTSQNIVVDSNCPTVELHAGDALIGRKSPRPEDNNTLLFEGVGVVDAPLVATCSTLEHDIVTSHFVPMSGPARRLRLRASHDVLASAKSELAIVEVEAVDAHDNPVPGALLDIEWSVSGPGTLVGPSTYRSDAGKIEESYGFGYIELPTSNVVRANEEPGEIVVTAHADGLAAGTVSIRVMKAQHREHPLVGQPAMSESGRTRVRRIEGFVQPFSRTVTVGSIRENIALDRQTEEASITEHLVRMVVDRNRNIDVNAPGFADFIQNLVNRVNVGSGVLIADDFNFEASKFNDYRDLIRYIESRDFHKSYARQLAEHFREAILQKAQLLDFGVNFAFVESVPRVHKYVHIQPSGVQEQARIVAINNVSHTTTVSARSLMDVLELLDPDFSELDADEKKRVSARVAEINLMETGDSSFYELANPLSLVIPSSKALLAGP